MVPNQHRSAAVFVGLVLAFGSAGCRTAEVASYNLDQLMAPEGRFRYVADVQSGWRFYFRQLFDPSWFAEDSFVFGTAPEPIEDPTDLALDNLLAVRGTTFVNDDQRFADHVRHFVWYATASPSALCRERALLELVPLAAEVRLEKPVTRFPEPANAAELSEALAGLTQALGPMLSPSAATTTEVSDFVAACELLGGRQYDIEGGRRLLRIVSSFTTSRRLERDELQPLRKLAEDVASDVVAQALTRGLLDPTPYVRAAAYRANYEVFGEPFLEEALTSLVIWDDGQPSSSMGLLAVRPDEEDLIVGTLGLLRENGMLTRAHDGDLAGREVRFTVFWILQKIARGYAIYGDRSRTAAMLVLQELSGSGLSSLREEDWIRWWGRFRDREEPAIEKLRNEAAARAAENQE
ncbi:MAG: hypothetical protein GY711_27020 [bacterium]|nr:hypothetical protein [bacterium]